MDILEGDILVCPGVYFFFGLLQDGDTSFVVTVIESFSPLILSYDRSMITNMEQELKGVLRSM